MGYLSFAPEFRRVMVDWRYRPHSRPTRGHVRADSTSTTCASNLRKASPSLLSPFVFLLRLDCLLCLSISDCADAGNGCDAVWLADIASLKALLSFSYVFSSPQHSKGMDKVD